MPERLFDADPYSKPRRNYRDERVAKVQTPPQLNRVTLGDVWRLYKVNGQPEVHAFHPRSTTVCDCLSALPLTFEPGTPTAACPDCWARGAR